LPIAVARGSVPGMEADFVIIGGGIAGISAAARLSSLGSVVVLEAEQTLAHHASGRSAALFEPRYGAPAVVGLSMASEAYFRSVPGVLSPRGLLLVGKADGVEAFEHDLETMAFDRITVAEAHGIVPILNPDTVTMAGYAAHAEDVDTDLLVQGFAREAKGRGAQVLTKARVSAIAKDGAGWRVTSAAGEFTARMLVNAAGAWVDQVAAMAGVRQLGSRGDQTKDDPHIGKGKRIEGKNYKPENDQSQEGADPPEFLIWVRGKPQE
jgi:glycine/D-amino acid oxidase-like deaminating enzyme